MNLKNLILLSKVLFSGFMIWFVSTKLDFTDSFTQISSMPVGWAIIIVALFYIQLALAAKRHHELLELLDCPAPYMRCLDATLVGYFFSQTFISFVGGDAMRTFRIAQSGISINRSAKAVILDRFSGFAGQITVLFLILPFLLPRLPDATMRFGMIGVVAVAILGVVGVIALVRLPDMVLRFKALNIISNILQRVIRRLGTMRGFYVFIVLAVIINLMNSLIFYVIAVGLSINVTIIDMVVMLPPVFFLSMLPISISGWGVREGATVIALGLVGVSAADSLSISICFGLALIIISLPGGVIWLISHNKNNSS